MERPIALTRPETGLWRITTVDGWMLVTIAPDRYTVDVVDLPALPLVLPAALRSFHASPGERLVLTVRGGVGGVDEYRLAEVTRVERLDGGLWQQTVTRAVRDVRDGVRDIRPIVLLGVDAEELGNATVWLRTSLLPTRVLHVSPTGDPGFLGQLMDALGSPGNLSLDRVVDAVAGSDGEVVFVNTLREQDLADFKTFTVALHQLSQQQRLGSLIVVSAPSSFLGVMSRVRPYADRLFNWVTVAEDGSRL